MAKKSVQILTKDILIKDINKQVRSHFGGSVMGLIAGVISLAGAIAGIREASLWSTLLMFVFGLGFLFLFIVLTVDDIKNSRESKLAVSEDDLKIVEDMVVNARVEVGDEDSPDVYYIEGKCTGEQKIEGRDRFLQFSIGSIVYFVERKNTETGKYEVIQSYCGDYYTIGSELAFFLEHPLDAIPQEELNAQVEGILHRNEEINKEEKKSYDHQNHVALIVLTVFVCFLAVMMVFGQMDNLSKGRKVEPFGIILIAVWFVVLGGLWIHYGKKGKND